MNGEHDHDTPAQAGLGGVAQDAHSIVVAWWCPVDLPSDELDRSTAEHPGQCVPVTGDQSDPLGTRSV